MPAYVVKTLDDNKLIDAYNNRPPYQRNDYMSWIIRAKQDATKQKRIDQMVTELKKGNVYMKMKWNPLNRMS